MQFFVHVVPKYLNLATFSKDLYCLSLCRCMGTQVNLSWYISWFSCVSVRLRISECHFWHVVQLSVTHICLKVASQTHRCLIKVRLHSQTFPAEGSNIFSYFHYKSPRSLTDTDAKNFYWVPCMHDTCGADLYTSHLNILNTDIEVFVALWHEGLYHGIQEISVKCL